RVAEAGDFTKRAYLNGKLDLLQAEAILDLVEGRSSAQHRAAIQQLDRGLSRRIEELRAALIECEALLVYEIDFPEEDEAPVPAERVDAAAQDVAGRIERLLETATDGELIREGALTVIAGRPNAGKSSLFNALCGVERVIVTDEPGTTRDAVEAVISLGGFPFRLVDTAGLREAAGEVERMGIEVARRYLAGADVVLFCAEAGRPLSADELRFLEDVGEDRVTLVRTKSDLAAGCEPDPPGALGASQLAVSTRTGSGLTELRDRLVAFVFAGVQAAGAEAPLVTRGRHARALRGARAELDEFLAARASRLAPEVAATHLRAAAHALEEMLGVIAPDDLLAQVFSQFCIGK
ncbi:MAG TPA: tRNA modification GTPase, partial [Gemmatimonadota bacterium]|nr:tRNA modification GTPase [Gemmatimonadota bacterium]